MAHDGIKKRTPHEDRVARVPPLPVQLERVLQPPSVPGDARAVETKDAVLDVLAANVSPKLQFYVDFIFDGFFAVYLTRALVYADHRPSTPTQTFLVLCVLGKALREVDDWEQLHRDTRLYFADFWNIVDFASILADTLTLALVRSFWYPRGETGARTFPCELYVASGSCALVITWMRLLYYVTVHKRCGTLIRMTLFMASDIVPFLVIVCFVLLGFGFAFFFVFLGEDDALDHDSVASVEECVYLAFKTLVHEPAFDVFEGLGDTDGGTPRQSIAVGLYVLYILVSNILLLNLLIAIMTSAYERVNADIHREFLFQKAEVIAYYTHLALPSPVNVFHGAYILARRVVERAAERGSRVRD